MSFTAHQQTQRHVPGIIYYMNFSFAFTFRFCDLFRVNSSGRCEVCVGIQCPVVEHSSFLGLLSHLCVSVRVWIQTVWCLLVSGSFYFLDLVSCGPKEYVQKLPVHVLSTSCRIVLLLIDINFLLCLRHQALSYVDMYMDG